MIYLGYKNQQYKLLNPFGPLLRDTADIRNTTDTMDMRDNDRNNDNFGIIKPPIYEQRKRPAGRVDGYICRILLCTCRTTRCSVTVTRAPVSSPNHAAVAVTTDVIFTAVVYRQVSPLKLQERLL